MNRWDHREPTASQVNEHAAEKPPPREVTILACGSRTWPNLHHIRAKIMEGLLTAARVACGGLLPDPANVTLVHGDQRSRGLVQKDGSRVDGGADWLADQVAATLGWKRRPYPAMWDVHGKAAGFVRNEWMSKLPLDVGIAFLDVTVDSKGTRDMMDRLMRQGVPVLLETNARGYKLACYCGWCKWHRDPCPMADPDDPSRPVASSGLYQVIK